MYECLNCHERKAIWKADFDFSDYGYEGEGIVSVYECTNCRATIEVIVSSEEQERRRE